MQLNSFAVYLENSIFCWIVNILIEVKVLSDHRLGCSSWSKGWGGAINEEPQPLGKCHVAEFGRDPTLEEYEESNP